jgi:hypothetical protein
VMMETARSKYKKTPFIMLCIKKNLKIVILKVRGVPLNPFTMTLYRS